MLSELTQMYTPVFRAALPSDDYREWWRLIRRFAGQVYDVALPDIGRVPARARSLQAKLGVKRLPPSLVEWIAFLEDLRRRSDWAREDNSNLWARSFPDHDAVSLNATSVGFGWVQSGIALTDFGHDDPPVNVYAYVASRNEHVLRKSYRRFPLSQWALHSVLGFGSNYAFMGSPMDDPRSFLRQLSEKVPVSASFANLRFVEGLGWFAYVRDGVTPYGREKWLVMRFVEGVKLRDIPKPLRDQVQMTSRSLRVRYRRQHHASQRRKST